MIDINDKLTNLTRELDKIYKQDKINIFSLLLSNDDEVHYEIIKYLLDPYQKHNLKDYFIQQIINIIKDKCEIKTGDYRDLNLIQYYDSGKYLSFAGISIINKVVFIFRLETENIDVMNSIIFKENYNQLLNHIDYIKNKYKAFTVIPLLFIDSEHLGKRFNALYTIGYETIINILKKMLKEVKLDNHNKFLVKEYVRSRESNFKMYRDKPKIPHKKCFEIYSKYCIEIEEIQLNASSYYCATLLQKILRKKILLVNFLYLTIMLHGQILIFYHHLKE